MDIATLTAETLEPLVGEVVEVDTSEGKLALRLDKVEPHPGANARTGAARAGFTMTLSGPLSPMLEQGAWQMSLPGLGGAALFLSPFSQTQEATLYEIVFN